jgi:vacuolar-type H+-ATPase subunit I/STV1
MIEDRVRRWAWIGFVAQVLFVASWLLAAGWQGSDYHALEHTISDMLAVGVPGAVVLIVVFTLCGLATILFAWLSVRPALRSGGRTATVGAVLLAMSIFGVGDLFAAAERQGCRLADPGCTGSDQRANLGGKIDTMITPTGIVLFVAAALVLAAAMKRAPGWQRWAWPFRGVAIGFTVLLFAFVNAPVGLTGLFERLLAVFGASAIAALALSIVRRSS